jgi:hypothetical protein
MNRHVRLPGQEKRLTEVVAQLYAEKRFVYEYLCTLLSDSIVCKDEPMQTSPASGQWGELVRGSGDLIHDRFWYPDVRVPPASMAPRRRPC